jgi:hypothetical protein
MAGQGISEAVPGWCEIEGCSEKFMQFMIAGTVHCKKGFVISPSPAEMSLTKLSLAGSNSIIPAQGEFGK